MEQCNVKVGDIVRPNHVGEDQLGRKVYWSCYKGRVVDVWLGEEYSEYDECHKPEWKAEVVWIGQAPYGVRKSIYPTSKLNVSSK